MSDDAVEPGYTARLEALEARCSELEALAGEAGFLSRTRDLREHTVGRPVGDDGDRPVAADAAAGDASPAAMSVGPPAVDHGVPWLGSRVPTAWRGGAIEWRRRAWVDLGDWVSWVSSAYCLEGCGDGWSDWWSSRGVVEELIALRDWHRELVDIEVPNEPPAEMEMSERVAWEAAARQTRLERGRDWVFWHDALARVAARLVGPEGRDHLTRLRGLSAPPTQKWAAELARRQRDGFTAFLQQLEVSPPPSDGVSMSKEV